MNELARAETFLDTAWKEGWTVSECGQHSDGSARVQLQKIDAPAAGIPAFADDADAWKHVVSQARAGSALHRDALQRVDRVERALIEVHCGAW